MSGFDILVLCLDVFIAYRYAKKNNIAMTVLFSGLSLLVGISIIFNSQEVLILIFDIGKCYEHTTGKKMRIISEIDTYYYGHALLGETDKAEYVPVGIGEDYAVNWKECEDFAKGDLNG